MGLFNLDSPFMQFLNKVADLMWLNVLTIIFCIPIVTAGASLTAMNYMALKIVRGEECYISRGFFKSFKENFKQATAIWFLLLLVVAILIGDFIIMQNSEMEFPTFVRVIILVVGIFVLFTAMFVFPTLARFTNTIRGTLKNAFMISVLKFPKTILMIIMYLIPLALAYFFPQIFPITFLFGLSAPALGSAFLYNKFFKELEDRIRAANPAPEKEEEEDDGERIFSDKALEGITEDPEITSRPR